MVKNITFLVALILAFLLNSCKKDEKGEIPELKITPEGITVSEDASGSIASISVSLTNVFDENVMLDFSTEDSTAIAGINYETAAGTVTFSAGQKSAQFEIQIIHDTTSKEDLYFTVHFSNPVNVKLNNEVLKVKIANADFANLVWSDEFDDESLNTSWWNYEQGNNNGWGNNELEVYTDSESNVHLDSGYLHITALNPSPSSYTSGRITTLGKKEFIHGRMEIRAKMPVGQGIWPALWMLGSNITSVSWPKCGEIDIMEYLGHEPERVYGTVHWDENGHKYQGGNKGLTSGTFHDDFHVFTLIWTANRLRWSVDGYQFYEQERKNIPFFPFDLPQFFIFNVAVGGNWPGYPDETTTFPQHMIVDYVRVYQ